MSTNLYLRRKQNRIKTNESIRNNYCNSYIHGQITPVSVGIHVRAKAYVFSRVVGRTEAGPHGLKSYGSLKAEIETIKRSWGTMHLRRFPLGK